MEKFVNNSSKITRDLVFSGIKTLMPDFEHQWEEQEHEEDITDKRAIDE